MSASLLQEADAINLALPAEMAMDVSNKVADAWKNAMRKDKDKVVLICDPRLRAPLAGMLARTVPPLPVIAYDEIVLGTEVEPIQVIAFDLTDSTMNSKQQLVGVSN